MRIVILANDDAGLYLFRKELIIELLKENEVYIALPYGKFVDPLAELGCKFIDVRVDRRGMNPVADLKLLNAYFSILAEVKPSLVITYTIKPNIYGGWACRVKRTPYAANITGLGTAFEKGGLLKLLAVFMYKRALKKAKAVFFENAANRDLFVREKIATEENACVLNGAGVNLERFSLRPYPDNATFKFLYVGRVMKEKGVDALFEATRRLIREGVNCFLDVVGRFEEDYEETIRRLEPEGWLRYLGFQDDVRPFIEACDCFVSPSYYNEGMANANLECAASGRPLITCDAPGCREAVVEGSGLLCKPKDVDSLLDAMRKIVSTPREERAKMGLLGRKHMETVFDKKKVVETTISRLFQDENDARLRDD